MFPEMDTVTSPEVSLKDKVNYFSNMCLHDANLDAKQSGSLQLKIKELIRSPMTRCEGLLLFEAALQQNTPFYVDIWPNIINANLKDSDFMCKEIALRILKMILRCSPCTAHTAAVNNHIPKIVELLVAEENANCLAAIQCLSICIKMQPGMITVHKPDIEEFIIKQMNTISTQMSEGLSECFIALMHCTIAVSGKDSSSIQSSYNAYLKKTLYTLQEILNKLLHSSEVVFIENSIDESDKVETFKLPDTSSTQFADFMALARIFASLSACLAKMISSEMMDKTEVDLPVLWILEFMNRVFEIIQNIDSREKNEMVLFVYPILHKGTFIILESLIQKFGLMEQMENIIQLIRKSVEASYISTFSNMSNSQMRYTTWKILNIWINKYGLPVSLNIRNKQYLIMELLKDIIPQTAELPEKMPKQQWPVSKGKKSEISFPAPGETSNFNESRMETCNESLKVLKTFIYTASPFLEDKVKEEIATIILTASKDVQKHINPHTRFPFPYMNEKCRKNLYELSLAFIISSHFFSIQVLMQAGAVLRIAQKEQSLKIKEFCYRATPMYRLLLHPKKKYPEITTNKKKSFEPTIEENVCCGWENVTTWSGNNSNNANNDANTTSHRPDKHIHLPPESVKSDNEGQNNLVLNKEFDSSELDSTSNTKEEIQCNGDDVSEVHLSSQSESENEDQCEKETPLKLLTNAVLSSKVIESEMPSDPDSSESMAEEESVAEEEAEEPKIDEEEGNELNCIESNIRADQNGLGSTSEEEMPSSSKGENGEYSSDEDGSYGEEEESKEYYSDKKHDTEQSENERPLKRQKVEDEANEVNEKIDDVQTGEVNDIHNEAEAAKETSSEEQEQCRNKSPTFEQMCGDLVLCESAELAES